MYQRHVLRLTLENWSASEPVTPYPTLYRKPAELARRGALVTVGCRDVERAKFLKPMGVVGQVTPVKADVTNAGRVARAVEGADIVISLAGILHQSGRNTFDAVQASGPQ